MSQTLHPLTAVVYYLDHIKTIPWKYA